MFDYLINYGIKNHTISYEELDVIDKMQLQDQINKVRREYYDLLKLLDEVQSKNLEITKKLSNRSKELISENITSRTNVILNSDDEYIELESEQLALKSGISMINNQLEFCKTDLKILQSVFYNKF